MASRKSLEDPGGFDSIPSVSKSYNGRPHGNDMAPTSNSTPAPPRPPPILKQTRLSGQTSQQTEPLGSPAAHLERIFTPQHSRPHVQKHVRRNPNTLNPAAWRQEQPRRASNPRQPQPGSQRRTRTVDDDRHITTSATGLMLRTHRNSCFCVRRRGVINNEHRAHQDAPSHRDTCHLRKTGYLARAPPYT